MSQKTKKRSFSESWAHAEKSLYLMHGEKPTTQRQFISFNLWETIHSYLPKNCNNSLEIGAGRGTISRYLASLGVNVTLLDIEESAMALARKNFAGITAYFVIGDINNVSLDKKFDLIVTIGLMEHLSDPRSTIIKIYKLLNAGGRLICYNAPAKWSTQHLINQIYKRPDYIRIHFPLDYFIRMLKNLGFHIIEGFHYKPYPIFNTQIFNPNKPLSIQTERLITKIYSILAMVRGKAHMKTNRYLAIGYIVVADKKF